MTMVTDNNPAGQPRILAGHTAVVTGAGSGVGFACAQLLADAGMALLLVGRSEDKLAAAKEKLSAADVPIAILAGDVADAAFANLALSRAATLGQAPARVLVNSAGVIVRREAVDTSEEDWHRVMRTNMDGVFYMSRAFAQQASEVGTIINVSSTCGSVGSPGLAAYCASKGAVNQLTRTMALELAHRRITVNAVAPGAIDSPMLHSEHATAALADSVVSRNQESIPIGDVAQPTEVARAVLFLATEPHVTGSILSVDGGYTAG